ITFCFMNLIFASWVSLVKSSSFLLSTAASALATSAASATTATAASATAGGGGGAGGGVCFSFAFEQAATQTRTTATRNIAASCHGEPHCIVERASNSNAQICSFEALQATRTENLNTA